GGGGPGARGVVREPVRAPRLRDLRRLSPPVHPSLVRDVTRRPHRVRGARLDGHRGPAAVLGRGPPLPPRELRPGRRPAQSAPPRGRAGGPVACPRPPAPPPPGNPPRLAPRPGTPRRTPRAAAEPSPPPSP